MSKKGKACSKHESIKNEHNLKQKGKSSFLHGDRDYKFDSPAEDSEFGKLYMGQSSTYDGFDPDEEYMKAFKTEKNRKSNSFLDYDYKGGNDDYEEDNDEYDDYYDENDDDYRAKHSETESKCLLDYEYKGVTVSNQLTSDSLPHLPPEPLASSPTRAVVCSTHNYKVEEDDEDDIRDRALRISEDYARREKNYSRWRRTVCI